MNVEPFLRELTPKDEDNVYHYLAQEPHQNVMMMAFIRDWGLGSPHIRKFYCYEVNDQLQGVISFSKDIALFGTPIAMRAFGNLVRVVRPVPRRIISPKESVDLFWETYQGAGLPIFFDRYQPLYAITSQTIQAITPEYTVREAFLSDTDALVKSSAAMNMEELGIDPLKDDFALYRSRIRALIERGRFYCITDSKGVAFQAAVYSQTPLSSQIASVYTRPDLRGKGLAKRALSTVCRRLLQKTKGCCLFVNDFNVPARKVYEAIGFKQIGAFRAIFLDPSAPEPNSPLEE